ncbi:MAG TPA: class I SAM-dependent methyltransferase [Patescibacteria group bacterium]|nr:class I SAM-dependent methyltransferase [Patescibacteria group bacterium]
MNKEIPGKSVERPDCQKMSDQEILDYRPEKMDYDQIIKYRKRLQDIRQEKGFDLAYTKNIWPEDGYMLKMFLEDNEGELNPSEMLYQEKAEYGRQLLRQAFQAKRKNEPEAEQKQKKANEFYAKYWDEEIDESEQTRRYLKSRAESPITNSPAGGTIEHLDSGRRKDSLWFAFNKPEANRSEDEKELLRFVKSLPDDIKILDLGCGLGSAFVKALQALGKLKPENRVNIDLDPKNIDKLKQNPDAGKSLMADARELPLPDNSQGMIVCNMMLADNYLNQRDQKKILKEIIRVLKEKGYLVGTVGFASSLLKKDFSAINVPGVNVYQRK